MGTNNIVFLENLEWFDDTGKELVHYGHKQYCFSGKSGMVR